MTDSQIMNITACAWACEVKVSRARSCSCWDFLSLPVLQMSQIYSRPKFYVNEAKFFRHCHKSFSNRNWMEDLEKFVKNNIKGFEEPLKKQPQSRNTCQTLPDLLRKAKKHYTKWHWNFDTITQGKPCEMNSLQTAAFNPGIGISIISRYVPNKLDN